MDLPQHHPAGWATVSETCAFYHIAARTLYRWLKLANPANQPPNVSTMREGDTFLIHRQELDSFLFWFWRSGGPSDS